MTDVEVDVVFSVLDNVLVVVDENVVVTVEEVVDVEVEVDEVDMRDVAVKLDVEV